MDALICAKCGAVFGADGGWRPLEVKPTARAASRIKIAAWLVGIPALLIILLLGYSQYANRSASRQATEFCAQARPGEPIAPLLAPGAGWKFRPIHLQERSRYVFIFPGFGMDKAICTVTVTGDKVRAAEAHMSHD